MGTRMDQLLEKEVFSYVDMYFAQNLLQTKEETPVFFLLCVLFAMARQGHLCLTLEDKKIVPSPSLLASEEADSSFLSEQILHAFHMLPQTLCGPNRPLFVFKNGLYLQNNFSLEKDFFAEMDRLRKSSLFFSVQEVQSSCCLNQEQNQALFCALRSPISLISGGPGTGKTFTAVEIVKAFLFGLSPHEREIAQVKFVAPTGKAAALLEKNVRSKLGALPGMQYGTLHSFLQHSFRETTPVFADLFLVDEASMLDAHLFVRLLSSLQPGGRLVLMGDKDQLPPVEAGGFFADLMDFASVLGIPSTTLVQGLRVENRELNCLAQKILQGDIEGLKQSEGMQIVPSLDTQKIYALIWEQISLQGVCMTNSPMEILQAMEKFRVLSAMKKGALGVESLNRMIIDRLIQDKDPNQILAIPILITENDKEFSLMNGDTGLLLAKVSSIRQGVLSLDDKAYFFDKIDQTQVREIVGPVLPSFSWGYCLSIHKSQGSEYDKVLILIPPGSERFGREILYTAVTRAKKQVHLIAQESCFQSILQKSARKHSGLKSHL